MKRMFACVLVLVVSVTLNAIAVEPDATSAKSPTAVLNEAEAGGMCLAAEAPRVALPWEEMEEALYWCGSICHQDVEDCWWACMHQMGCDTWSQIENPICWGAAWGCCFGCGGPANC